MNPDAGKKHRSIVYRMLEKMTNSHWFKQAIVYQIMIDRFAGFGPGDWRIPGFLGGNLKGIADKLEYLEALGINTLWLSPFYSNAITILKSSRLPPQFNFRSINPLSSTFDVIIYRENRKRWLFLKQER